MTSIGTFFFLDAIDFEVVYSARKTAYPYLSIDSIGSIALQMGDFQATQMNSTGKRFELVDFKY